LSNRSAEGSRITKLDHSDLQKAREFYGSLPSQVIIGLEASGYSQWFEDLLFELKHEIRIGNAAEIRKRARSPQKNDRRDLAVQVRCRNFSLDTVTCFIDG